ncbi:hypothetical protein [Pseudoroseicyclus aestuarii]|uniref:Uncharacterized protein n=1 Tax=Pseudoroseicyclus aestuarii TaxID=1795041 RepID=A0A318SVT7_9RHOB|nr:hypothetical protein [Pseudoroseicyclus aestuarii]PYE85545.1 hypothetical protein DFP88_101213 [Pseudoroseicyclus aestuarii]
MPDPAPLSDQDTLAAALAELGIAPPPAEVAAALPAALSLRETARRLRAEAGDD